MMHPGGGGPRAGRSTANRWRLVLVVTLGVVLVSGMVLGFGYLHLKRRVKQEVAERLQRLGERFHRRVGHGSIDIELGREVTVVTVRDLVLGDPSGARATVRIPAVTVTANTWEAARGDGRDAITAIVVPRIHVVLPLSDDESMFDGVQRLAKAELETLGSDAPPADAGGPRLPPIEHGPVSLFLGRGQAEQPLLDADVTYALGPTVSVTADARLTDSSNAQLPANFSVRGRYVRETRAWRVEVEPGSTMTLPTTPPISGTRLVVTSAGAAELLRPTVRLPGEELELGARVARVSGLFHEGRLTGTLEDVTLYRHGKPAGRAGQVRLRGSRAAFTVEASALSASLPTPYGTLNASVARASIPIRPARRAGTALLSGVRATVAGHQRGEGKVDVANAEVDWKVDEKGVVQVPRLLLQRPTFTATLGRALAPLLSRLSGLVDGEAAVPVPAEKGAPGAAAPWRRAFEAIRSTALRVETGRLSVTGTLGDELSVEKLEGELLPAAGARPVSVVISGAVTLPSGAVHEVTLRGPLEPDSETIEAEVSVTGLDAGPWLKRLDRPSWELAARVPTDLDLSIVFSPRHKVLSVQGTASFEGLAFRHRRLSRDRLEGIDVDARDIEVYATLADPDPIAYLRVGDLRVGKARLVLEARLLRGGEAPSFEFAFLYPRQPCQNAISTLPKAILGRLSDTEVGGDMAFSTSFALDLRRPRDLTWELRGDYSGCYLRTFGPALDQKFSDLGNRRYTHQRGRGNTTGPGSRSYVPLDEIPQYVTAAAVLTEDRGYYNHQGFIFRTIRAALRTAVKGGRFKGGGSTITQQLAKNLFLSRRKTIARKVQEAVLTWALERRFAKSYLLELYLNIIEYGPRIYGLARAAQFYFDKLPSRLDPAEGAFLMGLKPQPRWGYSAWKRGTLTPWWRKRIREIFDLLARRGHIPPEALSILDTYEMRFRR